MVRTAAETVVVGLGNPLRGDDGVGPEVVRLLDARGLPPGAEAVDAGTGGIGLLDVIGTGARVVVVDCARMGTPPGTIRSFGPREAASRAPSGRLSLHDVDPMQVLELARGLGLGLDLTVVGVEPETLEAGAPLSEAVRAALPAVVEEVLRLLEAPRRKDEAHGGT